MFSLLEEVEDGPGRKIAWMSGFIWHKNNIINYEKYNEYWYGEDASIIGKILPQLQKSRKWMEHRFVSIVRFIMDLIRIVLWIYSIVDFINIIDKSDHQTSAGQIIFLLLAILLILALPLIEQLAKCRFKRKLKQLLQQLNAQWGIKGYRIQFPRYVKKCCLFISCCRCFDDTNYQTIEIWQHRQLNSGYQINTQ